MSRLLTAMLVSAALFIQAGVADAAQGHKTLVLVSGSNMDIPPLTAEEVLFVFMDAPVVKNGVRLQPVLNESDQLLREVFLQKVMFMSWRHYQRRLVREAFSHGWPRPDVISDIPTLVQTLQSQPGTVTYMWESTAKSLNVKVVQVLWSGSVN